MGRQRDLSGDKIFTPKIGFTVGVWDMFHQGHINFLQQARNHCDYLVVGAMTDYWVRVQKGHSRPARSLEQRLVDLRESGLTDKLIILDTLDMTPYLQIADIWIRGEDQKNMRPTLYPNTVYIERTPNVSTTLILGGN